MILILTCAVCTSAQSISSDLVPEIHYFEGCFESGDTLIEVTVSGDEVGYVDFNKQDVVWTVPNFNHDQYDAFAYNEAILSRSRCKSRLGEWKSHDIVLPKAKVAPESTIYSQDEVVLEVWNTLICFVKSFYPPSINVTWTKNNLEVKEGVAVSQYVYNSRDGTFYSFASLSFIPKEGDIYACTTEHEALENPITRTWEMDETNSSVVFLGVCLTIGLLGVVIGSFLLVKQQNLH